MQKLMASYSRPTSAITDAALWETIITGDEASFAFFIRKYSKPLFNYGHRLCNDRDFLKDCIQDLFIEIWNRRDKICVGEQFKWYLFKSLRNSIFREQSKNWRNQPLPDEYDFIVEFDVEHHQIRNDSEQELVCKVKQTLEHLPPRQKEVLYLRYFEGLSFDDIAQIMDISKQSSHNLLQKAYKSFREKWSIANASVLAVSLNVIFSR
jgi:RNA polymerase sigma factor (sigma-70 family)